MGPQNKSEWRHRAIAVRQSLRPVRAERDRAIVERVQRFLMEAVPTGGAVVLFDALTGEVDLSALVSDPELAGTEISWALTRTPESGYDLTVHPYGSDLERHRYGYRQPVKGSATVPDDAIVAVLVPALAFDWSGNRIGFGAGYYDRFLVRLPTALRIGIADFIANQQLPAETFDISMTHLVSPDGLWPVQRTP